MVRDLRTTDGRSGNWSQKEKKVYREDNSCIILFVERETTQRLSILAQQRAREIPNPMKIAFAAAAAAAAFAAPAAMAGPYVNAEMNAGFTGSDYDGNAVDLFVGYEGEAGSGVGYFVEAGPVFITPESGDTEVELGGKAGVDFAVSDNVKAYGEFSFTTGEDENDYGLKAGLKYTF
jgi:hypothetical protein